MATKTKELLELLETLQAQHPDQAAEFGREFDSRETERKFARRFGSTYPGQAHPSPVSRDEYVLTRFVDAGVIRLDQLATN